MRLLNQKVSIIVPIYRVEQYLNRCINSIINQTYSNLEIILIDDGSPDKCPFICNEYAQKDDRVKVIHKENGGLSDARNIGLDISTGEYIVFIDSDDYIELNMIESMIDNMIQNEADLVVCNIRYIFDDRQCVKYSKPDRILDRFEAMKEYINDGIVQAVAWNKLYKKSIIGDMRYKVGKTNEDEFFTYKVIDKAKKIYYNSSAFYNYLQRESSIMAKYSIKRLDGVEASYERLNFMKENYPELYVEEKRNFFNLCIYSYRMILEDKQIDRNKKGRNALYSYIKNLKFNKYELLTYCFKDKVRILMSKISLNYCCILLNTLNG